MRVLLVEDEPAIHEAIATELEDAGVDLVIASTAEEALAALAQQGLDLIICDLKIPASSAAPEAHKTHGISVYDEARVVAPGVPIVVFSAYGDLADLGDRFAEAAPQNLYGRGQENIVTSRTKSQLTEVVELVRAQQSGFRELAYAVELSGAEARSALGHLDERVLRVHARKHGGTAAKVRLLAGGKSGAITVRVDVETAEGAAASRVVAKLNDLTELEDEERRYESHVAPLLNAGTYTNRLETIRAGARHRGGLFYSLAAGYERSLFDVLREDPSGSAQVVGRVRTSLAPWHGEGVVQQLSVRAVRQMVVRDARLADFVVEADWMSDELEGSAAVVRRARSHGDLHGGNVLVSQSGLPMLIDFGKTGEAVNALDAVTLELSAVLHPDATLDLRGWPKVEQAENWNDRVAYLVGCPIADFVNACRDWSDDVSRGDREVDAAVYAFGLRQLLFPDAPHELAAAFSRGAARRLVADAT